MVSNDLVYGKNELVCWRTASGTEPADAAFSESVSDTRFVWNDPGWSFQPQKALPGISWDANMYLSWSKHKGQNFHGSFPPTNSCCFAFVISPTPNTQLKSQPIGRHCQVTECRAEKWVLWVQYIQGHACFKMTDRITVLLSRVRATEGRGKGYCILLDYSMISFQMTLSRWSGTSRVSRNPSQEEKHLASLSPW